MYTRQKTNLVPNLVGARVVREYIEEGQPLDQGDFYYELVTNDLKGACRCADSDNKKLIWEWVAWFHNHAPEGCWGSVERYEAWVKRGGLIEN